MRLNEWLEQRRAKIIQARQQTIDAATAWHTKRLADGAETANATQNVIALIAALALALSIYNVIHSTDRPIIVKIDSCHASEENSSVRPGAR